MFYDIDFDALIRSLLPVRLRKAVMEHWLRCLVQPVKDVYQWFIANRNANLYTLSHNSQVVYLQAALNDMFDPATRGIYISEVPGTLPVYVYLPAEHHPQWLAVAGETPVTYSAPMWLYTSAETALSGYDFVVMVPMAVLWEPVRMRALIDKYRLPSRGSYTIVTY
jgi:hypothetical protein